MRMWSKGLGRVELVMDPATCIAKKNLNKEVVVYGSVKEPVTWEFKGTISAEDIPGILALVLTSWDLIWLIIKNLPNSLWLFMKRKKIDKKELTNKVDKAFETTMGGNRRQI